MLNGDGIENGKKTTAATTTIGLISKKTALHVQHFFVHFFTVVATRLQRETFYLQVLRPFCCLCSCSLSFSLPLFFTLLLNPFHLNPFVLRQGVIISGHDMYCRFETERQSQWPRVNNIHQLKLIFWLQTVRKSF